MEGPFEKVRDLPEQAFSQAVLGDFRSRRPPAPVSLRKYKDLQTLGQLGPEEDISSHRLQWKRAKSFKPYL